MRFSIAIVALLFLVGITPARSISGHLDSSDAAGRAQLEQRAEHADAREQCFLYTELVHVYTDLAGKQLAAGDTEHASVTLKKIQGFAERIHLGLARDSKRLKNAEILMHNASYRLAEYMHLVSSEDKEVVESTRKQLDKLNDELLAQVFSR